MSKPHTNSRVCCRAQFQTHREWKTPLFRSPVRNPHKRITAMAGKILTEILAPQYAIPVAAGAELYAHRKEIAKAAEDAWEYAGLAKDPIPKHHYKSGKFLRKRRSGRVSLPTPDYPAKAVSHKIQSFIGPKMPRFTRKRKRRSRGRRSSYAKRRRRVSKKYKRKRRMSKRKMRPRAQLANRYMPKTKLIKFVQIGQIQITTTGNQWGIVRFPLNTMESPLFYVNMTSAGGYYLKCHTYGATTTRPHGVDQWMAGSAVGALKNVPGRFDFYEVQSSKIKITHLPGTATSSSWNFFGGTNTYNMARCSRDKAHGTGGNTGQLLLGDTAVVDDVYQQSDVTSVSSLLYKGAPFSSIKHFNSNGTGTSWTMNWNQRTAKRKNKDSFDTHGVLSEHPVSQRLTNQGPEDPTYFLVRNGHFMLAQIADNSGQALDFIVRMEYTCKLTDPTDWARTGTDAAAADDNFL